MIDEVNRERSEKMAQIVEQVFDLAEPIVDVCGLNLVDVEYQKEGDRWYLRVFIENPEGELKLKSCEKINRMLGSELDAADIIDRSYILEVSSPGLERPLKKPDDYLKNIGKSILVKTYAPIDGSKEFTGELISYQDDQIVELNSDKGVIKIPVAKIAKAHLLIDF